jgi:hypothetical protein
MTDNKDLEFNQKLSQEFSLKNLNVLVWTNTKTHKNLYLKVGKRNKDAQIELIPLDENELKDLHLEESLTETVNGELFDLDIQESVSEDSPVQPLHKFRSDDVNSMRLAKQMAEENLKKLEGKDSEKEALEAENEDLRSKIDLIAQKAFEKKKRELNAPDEVNTPEKLMGYEMAQKAKTPTSPQNSGCVPLSSQTPANQDSAYGSYEEMVDNIRDRASAQNPNLQDRTQAKAVLDKLMEKAFSGQKESLKPFDYQMPKDISINEILDRKYQRRKMLARRIE